MNDVSHLNEIFRILFCAQSREKIEWPVVPCPAWFVVAQVSVSIFEEELESHTKRRPRRWPHGQSTDSLEFAFRITGTPHDHEAYIVFDIDVRFRKIVSIFRVRAPTFADQVARLLPKFSSSIVGNSRQKLVSTVVAIDGFVVLFFATKVTGKHRRVPALTKMILSPVFAIQIDMNEPAVRCNLAHIEQRIVSIPVRHISATLIHVMGARSEREGVKFIHRRNFVFESIKCGILQRSFAILFSKIETIGLLVEVREKAAIPRDAAIDVKAFRSIRIQPLYRTCHLRLEYARNSAPTRPSL